MPMMGSKRKLNRIEPHRGKRCFSINSRKDKHRGKKSTIIEDITVKTKDRK